MKKRILCLNLQVMLIKCDNCDGGSVSVKINTLILILVENIQLSLKYSTKMK